MPDPEIARRCPSCGASIRERAFFCPQCGASLGEKASDTSELTESDKTTLEDKQTTAIKSETPIAEPSVDVVRRTPRRKPDDNAPAAGARQKIQRAATGAREAFEGDVVERVEQLRKISIVVLDQAAYDPSLRFILVAAVLFLIFLTILLLSKIIA